MSRADELRAELAVVELEEQLRQAKEDPDVDPGSKKFRALKERLRKARCEHRTLRAGRPPEPGSGDAVVRPEAVEAKTSVQRPGGDAR